MTPTTVHECARCASGCSRARYETEDSTCRCEDCHTAPVALTPPTLEERVRAHRELADYAHLMYSRRASTRREYLHELRRDLHDAWDEGTLCPVCDQFVKVYERTIHTTMARQLIAIYNAGGATEYVHLIRLLGHPGDVAKTRYWGLLTEMPEVRPDGGHIGWWKLTDDGVSYVHGALSVPKYARVYDGKCLELHGPNVDIDGALGTKFDRRDLMHGARSETMV